MRGYEDPARDDPSKRDLYEDQVPPHAPAVPGNGSSSVDEAPADEVSVDEPAKPKRPRKPRAKAANDGDQADAQ